MQLLIFLFKLFIRKTKSIVKPKTVDVYKQYTFVKETNLVEQLQDEVYSFLNECNIDLDTVLIHDNFGGGICFNSFIPKKLSQRLGTEYLEYNYSNKLNQDKIYMMIPDFSKISLGYNLKKIDTFLHELCHYLNHWELSYKNITVFVQEFEAITYAKHTIKKFKLPIYSINEYATCSKDLYIEFIEEMHINNVEYFIEHLNQAKEQDLKQHFTREMLDFINHDRYRIEYEKFKQYIK